MASRIFRSTTRALLRHGNGRPSTAAASSASIVFSTRHSRERFYKCIGEFSTRNINLTNRVATATQPALALRYLDWGHLRGILREAALMGLLRHASFVKFLGSYPASTPVSGETLALRVKLPETSSAGTWR